ncbi:MAG: cupin domain-containing protein [Thermomicrobiales bacterium]
MDGTGKFKALASGDGPSYLIIDNLVTVKVTGTQTDGAYAITETIVAPGGGVPGLHTHAAQETFYILEGEFAFPGVSGTVHASAGDVVHIPGGVPHTNLNVGGTTARYLAVFAPAGMDAFFAEVGEPVSYSATVPEPQGPPDMARFMAICDKHGVAFAGPPPPA